MQNASSIKCNLGLDIGDPLWDKVQLGANYNPEIHMKIAESGPLVV